MRRTGNLWEAVLERDNLRLAYSRALRGKRSRADARRFGECLEENVRRMQDELRAGTIAVGRFHQFVIHDPKERIITAPCFEERVLHHAVMNVCEPVLERWLIDDTFACRQGKGRIAALQRTQQFARRFDFFLKLDVRKYFDSVPHEELLARLECRLKDLRLLELLARIVRVFRGPLGRGLPIGSLTSQHLANFYLGWLDRFVKESLHVKGYVRYMDDVVLWGASSANVLAAGAACREFLFTELGLHAKPWFANRSVHGLDFLGCRVYPSYLALNRRSSRRRFARKLKSLQQDFDLGEIDERESQARSASLIAFTRTPGVASWRFRSRVLQQLRSAALGLEPGEPGRELEQLRQELPVGEPQQEHAGQPEQQPGLPSGPSSARAADAATD